MNKKYDYQDNSQKMVSEPIASYNTSRQTPLCGMASYMADKDDDFDLDDYVPTNPKLYISDDELRRLGRECINAPRVSAEEAIRHFLSL